MHAHSTRYRHQALRRLLEDHRQALARRVHRGLTTIRLERSEAERGDASQAEAPADTIAEEIDLAVLQMKTEAIALIDQALERLASGHYGRCAACGRDIALARLRALPFAVRCLRCQTQEEDVVHQRRSQSAKQLDGLRERLD